MAPLLLLPNLEILRLAGVDDLQLNEESSDDDYEDALSESGGDSNLEREVEKSDPTNFDTNVTPPGDWNRPVALLDDSRFLGGHRASSVKTLSFNMCEICSETVKSFIRACKSLREFRCCPDAEEGFETDVFDALLEHRTSLETLELFASPDECLRTLDPRLAHLEKLTRLEIPFGHLINHSSDTESLDHHMAALSTGPSGERDCAHDTVLINLQEYLPASLEYLTIKNERQVTLSTEEVVELLETLIDLVEGEDGLPPKHNRLRQICVAGDPCLTPENGDMLGYITLSRLCEEKEIEFRRVGNIAYKELCYHYERCL